MAKGGIIFHPIISSIQKIALYETKARFYLVGSNNKQTRFRVLKIDRTEPRELVVVDDGAEYSQEQIRDLVTMIDVGNRTRVGQRLSSNGVARIVSAFGIVGRTLNPVTEEVTDEVEPDTETEQSKPSLWHSVWKRDRFPLVVSAYGLLGFVCFLEGYYVILVTKRRRVAVIGHHTIYKIEDTTMIYIPNNGVRTSHPDEQRYLKMFQNIDLSSNFYFSYSYDLTHTLQSNMTEPSQSPATQDSGLLSGEAETASGQHSDTAHRAACGVRNQPHRKFAWNSHLLSQIENEGDVANEVETEQILHDSGVSSMQLGRYTSFVQLRGSIPAHWSQDMSKMVPKPTISFNLADPYAETAGKHFDQLLGRFGAPVIILNLVKKREQKKQESMLSEEFSQEVRYLNQFLPPDHHVQYVSFDMARVNKRKEAKVMSKLADIARSAVCKTGLYQSQAPYYNQSPQSVLGHPWGGRRLQTGVIRVNCVDCLDRTNTAQFAIGKCALGFQLCALGVLDSPRLEFDTDCVRMLEELYEDHGDTLALQYGGSQLVHRIKTYRKTAPWTSQGNDIMQTLSRYYSNTFSDAEKQHTMNLFLGLFVPHESQPPIWDMLTDYYLHHPVAVSPCSKQNRRPLSQWWDPAVLSCLPQARDDAGKALRELVAVRDPRHEAVDCYQDYHRPYELTVLAEAFTYISHSVRDFMPHFTTNYSPFTMRVRPGRRREETATKGGAMKNPSMTGQSSTSSTTSSASESDSDDSDEPENSDSQQLPSKDSSSDAVSFESLFPSMRQVYGMEVGPPSRQDVSLYKRFVAIGHTASEQGAERRAVRPLRLLQRNVVSLDTSAQVAPPRPSLEALQVYQRYVQRGTRGASEPSPSSLVVYQRYAGRQLVRPQCW
ncbi:polyphosphoinositide phosphatase isoform X3 [Bacillus rossius redtenbacheri]|uniref:polyphosphoinositide phosphatase isoform X3 n=1 Tax=Bacillus rossius redtenbacheri TaxID=93214 RepID=UPI002FDD72A7